MKLVLSITFVICLSLLAGCTIGNGHICGPQTPLAYCDREAYERLVHPKGLGEYWEKPGMTKDSWRVDWVECGGRPNGDYSTDTPQGSTHELISEDFSKKSKEIWVCMTNKGYQYTAKYWPK